MKKILLLILIPYFIFAQKAKKQKEPRLFLSASFNQQTNDLLITPDQEWSFLYANENFYKPHSSNGYNCGVGFKISSKSDLLLQISFLKNKLAQTAFFSSSWCDPSLYNAKQVSKFTRYVSMNTLNIPFEYRYKILTKGKFSIYPSVGFSLNFTLTKKQSIDILLDNGIIAHNEDNEINLDSDNPVNLVPFAKIGFRYHLVKPIYVKVEPFYAYHVGKEQFLTKTKNSNLFAYGVNVGVEYVLKK